MRILKKKMLVIGCVMFLHSLNVAAGEWFVRPAGGNYGKEDGSSYQDAWEGLTSVVWGEGGVVAGDTLYVCDTHINTYDRSVQVSEYRFTPKASGTSENYITIKGHPDHPAIIWNAYIDGRSGGISPDGWTEPNTPGCYYQATSPYRKIYGPPFENISGESSDRYTKLDSAEEVINSSEKGVYYKEDFGDMQGKIWLRPFNAGTFTTNLYFSGAGGYSLVIGGGNNYIEYDDITFLFMNIQQVEGVNYHHYTFKNCKFDLGGRAYGYQPHDCNNITFDGCEFTNAGNGIYVIQASGDVHHLYILNSYFHDLGTPYNDDTGDNHAIGIANHEYIYIIGNRFERCDSAMDFHVGKVKTQYHIYVIGNYINDMRITGKANSGGGIIFEGAAACPKENQGDYLVANNIVANCEYIGICPSRANTMKVYNNIVYNCAPNYKIQANALDGSQVEFYNNISAYPKEESFHIYFNQNHPGISWDFKCDNNIYYPNADQPGAFYCVLKDIGSSVATLSEWKAYHLEAGDTVDENSLIEDPLFVDPGNGNFNLILGSLAIDAGVDVGLTQDFDGNPIPLGSAPDIGAYEYMVKRDDPQPEPDPDPPIEPEDTLPDKTELKCFNNIFNPTKGNKVIIRAALREQAELKLIVYNSKGRKIIILAEESKPSGFHTYTWNGKDDSGNTVGSGIYIVHMRAGGYKETKKIAVVK